MYNHLMSEGWIDDIEACAKQGVYTPREAHQKILQLCEQIKLHRRILEYFSSINQPLTVAQLDDIIRKQESK